MDISKLIGDQLKANRKEDAPRRFLMTVTRVQVHETNPDLIKVFGVRTDTRQDVAVVTKKSSAGQYIPEVGGVMRADKTERLTSQNATIRLYKAQYFHAYRQGEFALEAIVQAPKARRSGGGMWTAQVSAFDLEVKVVEVRADRAASSLKGEILRLLKPWTDTATYTPITHDVAGRAIWGNGDRAIPGITPFVAIRIGTNVMRIWGTGVVKEGDGKNATYRFPTDQELIARIEGNVELHEVQKLLAEHDPSELAKAAFYIIPALAIDVGRDALAGEKQSYLSPKEAFHYRARADSPDVRAGYRSATLHLKMSRSDRMILTDATAAAGFALSSSLPYTQAELRVQEALRGAGEALAAPDSAERSNQNNDSPSRKTELSEVVTSSTLPRDEHEKRSATQPADARRQDRNTVNASSQANQACEDEDLDDWRMYTEDLEAIERFTGDQSGLHDVNSAIFEDDMDSILQEAAARQAARRGSMPSM